MLKNDKNKSKPMSPRKEKAHVSLTIDKGLLEWIDKKVENFNFQSRSHAIEQAIYKLKTEQEKAKE